MGAPAILRKVKDDEGHEHGSDGRFVSTGTSASAKTVDEMQAEHEEKYGKRPGKETRTCPKCDGKKVLNWVGNIDNGRCWGCMGKGTVEHRIDQPKVVAARAEREAKRQSEATAEQLLREYEIRQKHPKTYERLGDRAKREMEAYGDGGHAALALSALLNGRGNEEGLARSLRVAEQRLIEDGHLGEGDITEPNRNGKGFKRSESEMNSDHIGTPGEKMQRVVTVDRVVSYEGNYGTGYIVMMHDDEGNKLKWFTSNPHDLAGVDGPAKKDIPIELEFKVKQHGTYDGVKETTVTHVKVPKPKKTTRPKGAPPILRKVRDDEGHEHGNDGRFSRTSGHAKGKEPPKHRYGKPGQTTVSVDVSKVPKTKFTGKLWHTTSKDSAEKIVESGFNSSGKNGGKYFGPGTYFYRDSASPATAYGDTVVEADYSNTPLADLESRELQNLHYEAFDAIKAQHPDMPVEDIKDAAKDSVANSLIDAGFDGIQLGAETIIFDGAKEPKSTIIASEDGDKDGSEQTSKRGSIDPWDTSTVNAKSARVTPTSSTAGSARIARRGSMSGSPPILRKVRDDSGHEHGNDGRFSRTSGHAKGKKPREAIEHETIDSYPHPKTGASMPMHHAGGRTSWGGKFSDVAETTFGTQFQRWDAALPDNLADLDDAHLAPYLRHVQEAHANMRNRINTLENSFADKRPHERAAERQKNKALYYDRARAWRCATGLSEDRVRNLVTLQRTAGFARLLATKNPKNMAQASVAYESARELDPTLPELSDEERAREVLLHKFGVDARSTIAGVVHHETADYFDAMFLPREPTHEDMLQFEWAMDRTWKDLGLNATPAALTFGDAQPGAPLGVAFEAGAAVTIACLPSDFTGKGMSDQIYVGVIAHEMAHALSHKNFSREMTAMNTAIRAALPQNPKPGELHLYLTLHGVNSRDVDRYPPSGEQGDFQEDWAIALAEQYLVGSKAVTRPEFSRLPARETVEMIGSLLDLPLHKAAMPLRALKQWPTAANPNGLPESMVFKI
jgi:hypothetical protein